MKILLSSYAFYPSVGGIEAISAMLAEEFLADGHEVKVVTDTREEGDRTFSYEVIRHPSPFGLIRAIRWSDAFVHINVSLQLAWPLLLTKKPWVIAHHTWLPKTILGELKQRCALAAHNISISHAIADHLRAPSTIITNSYDHEIFVKEDGSKREKDLVFVGRLVSDKGVDCALTALHLLKQRQTEPSFTIVGGGPEEAALRRLASKLGIAEQVNFAGVKRGAELARELRRHKIIVIPSLWEEPFGIVALEGIASGCVAVGSRGGGLKDAIGPCGITFPNGDSSALAGVLAELLADETKLNGFRQHATHHLAGCTRQRVAQEYMAVIKRAVNQPPSPYPAKAIPENQC
jgi:glycosyltransferase involved in cell wall biosynthesis